MFSNRPFSTDPLSTGEHHVYTYESTGYIRLTGDAALAKSKAFAADGYIRLTGDAALAKSKAFTAGGSITLTGEAAYTETDDYAGSGALVWDGHADTVFIQRPVDRTAHGRGDSFPIVGLYPTIDRYKPLPPRVYIYRADGGLAYSGAAGVAYKSAAVARTASVSGVILRPFAGRARVRYSRSADAVFMLLAA